VRAWLLGAAGRFGRYRKAKFGRLAIFRRVLALPTPYFAGAFCKILAAGFRPAANSRRLAQSS
jgi:hypothetical protein